MKEPKISIGLIELISAYLGKQPSWTKYFPHYVGFGWKCRGECLIDNEIVVTTPYSLLFSYNISLEIHRTKIKYLFDNNEYSLPVSVFKINVIVKEKY